MSDYSIKYIFICIVFVIISIQVEAKIFSKSKNDNFIYLNEKSSQTIRLKSVLSLSRDPSSNSNSSISTKTQKIFWSFKRIYSIPKFLDINKTNTFVKSTYDLSQLETMISLDSEVEDNLKEKYSIDAEASNFNSKQISYDLIIRNLSYADSGLYKCNLWNQKTIYYNLIVSAQIYKPEVSLISDDKINLNKNFYNTNKIITESSNLSLKCVSKYAHPYPAFRWFRNNKELHLDDDKSIFITHKLIDKETNTIESVLNITNVHSSFHMNNFTCKLVQIQEMMIEQKMEENGEENIKTGASLNDYTNEQQLWKSSETLSLNIGFKPILTLDVVKTSQLSPPVSLLSLNPNIVQNNYKLYLYNDSDILFKCLYKSNPIEPVQIVWKINDIVQTDANRDAFSWMKRTNLVDLTAKRMNLTCEVSNPIGKSSFTYDITLLHEPKIKLDKLIYDVDELSPLQISCMVDSSPSATLIEWRRYNLNINSTNMHTTLAPKNYELITAFPLLEFKSIKHTENSGFYDCIAINTMNDSFGVSKMGESRMSTEINVRFMPQMNVIARKMAANLTKERFINSQKHTISCMTMANPQPSFTWALNGVKLNTSSAKYKSSGVFVKSKNLYENSLIIYDLTESDLNKKYICEAANTLGSNKLEVELVPLSRPDRPTELRVLYVSFYMITLGWSSGFDGGLEQTFTLEINDTLIELDTQYDKQQNSKYGFIKYAPSLVNITSLSFDTTYTIRVLSKNKLGASQWSDYVIVKTSDLTASDVFILPVFDTVFLNVPKNRLEYTFRPQSSNLIAAYLSSETWNESLNETTSDILAPICLNIKTIMNVTNDNSKSLEFDQCLPFNYIKHKKQFSFDSLYENDSNLVDRSDPNLTYKFNSVKVSSIKVSVCFQIKSYICTSPSTNAIIDTYNKKSYSSLISSNKKQIDAHDDFILNNSLIPNGLTIPVTLIIGICVCILCLLILLFSTVIYCIRKRNFKLCKALIPSDLNNNNNSPTKPIDMEKNEKSKSGATVGIINESDKKLSHINKTFNIDIGSISAPLANTLTSNKLTKSCSIDLSGNKTNFQNNYNQNIGTMSNRRTFTAALTATANNIISNSIGKHKINEILVTEDDEQQKKQMMSRSNRKLDGEENKSDNQIHIGSSNTSSTAISNCSSITTSNHMGAYIYNEFSSYEHQQHIDLFNKGLTFIDTYNSGTSASSGSNSDPIAINNSLSSSNSTTDSPTYGYNLATGVNGTLNIHHHNLHNNDNLDMNDDNSDNLLYIKTAINQQHHKTFPPLNDNNNYIKSASQVKQMIKQQSSSNLTNAKNSQFNGNEQPESGYSTPSRPKKVVYEVIV